MHNCHVQLGTASSIPVIIFHIFPALSMDTDPSAAFDCSDFHSAGLETLGCWRSPVMCASLQFITPNMTVARPYYTISYVTSKYTVKADINQLTVAALRGLRFTP